MKKIVFLDIDGVIATPRSQYQLDREKMEIVKRICDEADANIVITSSWRRDDLPSTIKNLVDNQKAMGEEPFLCPERIVDVTSRMFAFKLGNISKHYRLPRGVEIDRWLEEHPEVRHFVILDDDYDFLGYQMPHFVRVNPNKGILKKDAEKAIRILKTEF